MSNKEELKPCPFCGGEPKIERSRGNEYVGYAETVSVSCCVYMCCDDKMNSSGNPIEDDAYNRVVERWNKRA